MPKMLTEVEGYRERRTSANTDKKIEVRRSKQTDTFVLKPEDALEVMYSHGFTPDEAISKSLDSPLCYTVVLNQKPCIIFGINPLSVLGNDAIIFMLSDERINEIGYRFVRHSRECVDYFLSYYNHFFNYVHVANTTSIRWLQMLNAKFDAPKPYGKFNEDFMRFEFRRVK